MLGLHKGDAQTPPEALSQYHIGTAESQGGRLRMEDIVTTSELSNGDRLIIDLDGHGPSENDVPWDTHQAANTIELSINQNRTLGTDTIASLQNTIEWLHAQMPERTGATCCIQIFTPQGIYTANVGDARSYLVDLGTQKCLELTTTYTLQEEDAAIRSRGGWIEKERIHHKDNSGKDIAGLNTPRTVGDRGSYDHVVSHKTDISFCPWPAGTTMVVTGSDGVWNLLNPEEILPGIGSETDPHIIAKRIVAAVDQRGRESAQAREKTKPDHDNSSVVVTLHTAVEAGQQLNYFRKCEHVGYFRSNRVLAGLEELGWVAQSPSSKKYNIGPLVWEQETQVPEMQMETLPPSLEVRESQKDNILLGTVQADGSIITADKILLEVGKTYCVLTDQKDDKGNVLPHELRFTIIAPAK